MNADIDTIVSRELRSGVQLVDDPVTHEVALEAHRLGRHANFPGLFGPLCPACFAVLISTGKLVIR